MLSRSITNQAAIVYFISVVFIAGKVNGAENRIDASINSGAIYDTNRRMDSYDERDLVGVQSESTLSISNSFPTFDCLLVINARDESIEDDENLEADWTKVKFNGGKQLEKIHVDTSLSFNRIKTLAAEIQEISSISANTYQYQDVGTISAQYFFSEKYRSVININGQRVNYDNGEQYGLNKYDYYEFSAGFAADISEDISLTTSVFGNQLLNDDVEYQRIFVLSNNGYYFIDNGIRKSLNRSVGIKSDMKWSMSERRSLRLMAGIRNSEFVDVYNSEVIDDSEDRIRNKGYVTGMNFKNDFYFGSFELDSSLDMAPDGESEIVEYRNIGTTYRFNLSEFANFSASLGYRQQRDVTDSRRSTDANTASVSLRLSRRITRSTDLGLRIYHFERKIIETNELSRKTAAYFSIEWRDKLLSM